MDDIHCRKGEQMKRIYKYTLDIDDEQNISMPYHAEILTVQNQHGSLCLWAIVDDEEQGIEERRFAIYGTGNPAQLATIDGYIGTAQQMNGTLIWHVFEITAF